MALDFDDYKLSDVVNPNMYCTQVIFTTDEDPDIKKRSLILFDHQIKYIEVEEHQKFKRVKIYVRGDEQAINLDFAEEDREKFDLFLKSVYNK